MAPERWREIEAIFGEVAALPAGERANRLTRLCGGDAELRLEVESLLAADDAGGDFLERPAVAPGRTQPRPPAVGRRFGPYSVERQLGEGGMSTVYLAVRADEEYRRRVAIKVFAYGAERAGLVERFRAERQILASLDHPNIAGLLDGGTTDDGLPYLVMEYVDGVPIDRWCEERRLSIGERLDLFRQVCAAVQYAHQNLVVHRDIKPSNILVTADGVPHLLDFGIAKILGGSALARAAETTIGQRLMTPHYASPEQVEGTPVTTASDVYSLGVLLYVLLTGRLPYRLEGGWVGEIEQAVVEQQPERPSAAAGSRKLARQLAGDLDNIVLMALRKEPARRYASVALLAEDLRRHRAGLPVLARPTTVRYRVGKFVRRHRLGSAVAALLAAVILGLAASMTVQAARLARQRDEIRRERDRAVRVAALLEEVFSTADPNRARGETITAREVLDRGAAWTTTELADQPETQATLAATIGRAYGNLGLYDRSRPLLERSLALRRRVFGPSHPEVAESLHAIGTLHSESGDLDRAEATLRQALAMRRTLLGDADPAVAESLNALGLALTLKARFDAAEPLLREALAINRRYANDPEKVGDSLANLGFLRWQKGELAAAEALNRQALAIFRRRFGATHPKIVIQLNNLAVLQGDRGAFAAAAASYRELLPVARRILGEEHPEVALYLHNLATMLTWSGKYDEAERLARQSLALRRKHLGDEHEQVAMGLNQLARILEEKGDLAGSRPLFEESLRLHRRTFGEEHPRVGMVLANLANLLLQQGDPAAAEPLARQALAIRRQTLGDAHADVGSSLVLLGALRLARGGGPAEAEPLLRQGYETLRAALSETHWRTADAQSQLGACLAALGRRAEAEPLLTAGFATLAGARGPRDLRTLAAEQRLLAFRQGQ